MPSGICIFAEVTPDKKLSGVTLELAGKALELSQKLNGETINALLITGDDNIDDLFIELSQAGINNVWMVQDPKLKNYSTDLYAKAAYEVIKQKDPSIMLIGATTTGRDIAPRLSSQLDTGLTADCTELDINEKGQLAATRPTFGGELMATILCKKFPQMATIRPKVMPKPTPNYENKAKVEKIEVDFSSTPIRTELIEFTPITQSSQTRIDEAEVIIAGGKGLKNAQNFKMLEELAQLLGGTVGASRCAVDAGWCDHSVQIGQTGKTVTPKIYIACGISGAIQHLAGMNSSDIIIAINKDPKAPIFKAATYGIVGDVFEIVPKMIEELKKQKVH